MPKFMDIHSATVRLNTLARIMESIANDPSKNMYHVDLDAIGEIHKNLHAISKGLLENPDDEAVYKLFIADLEKYERLMHTQIRDIPVN
jgi:hypothetical protein